jgi:hypothetical protein
MTEINFPSFLVQRSPHSSLEQFAGFGIVLGALPG